MNQPLILIVEDDKAVRNLIAATLDTQDYRYLTAGTGEQGCRKRRCVNRISCCWILVCRMVTE